MLKKIFYTIFIMASMSHYSKAQSPSINYFLNMDSCDINLPTHMAHIYLTLNNAVTGLNTTIYWGDGTSINEPIGSGWLSQFHQYTLPGNYTALAVLFDGANNAIDSSQINITAYCSYVKGSIYKRNDANCNYDDGVDDLLYSFQQIEIRKNNIPIDTFIINSDYIYQIPQPDLVSEFSCHPINNLSGYLQTCPSIDYKFRLDTLNGSNNLLDYGYECDPGNLPDLYTYMSGYLRFVNNSYLSIIAGNTSCTPQNGTVTLNIDPQYTYFSASIIPSSISGQTITWDLTNLSGVDPKDIAVVLHPADTLTPGDSSCHIVTITPTAGDINTSNNTYNFCDTIHASYDPNEKKVSPMGAIGAGQLLTYTINFENLGNDTAFNIHIIDTLSANIDPSSFEIIASSHRVNTNLFDYGATKIIKFDFNNINLEDKDHPYGNKGFVMYQAKAKNNLVAGDEIKNTAHIFFDINPAIVTNTVSSKIPIPNGVKEVSKSDGLKVYPNPAKNLINIENQNNLFNQVKILNAVGQIIKEVTLKNGDNKVDISGMNAGIYYLLISGNDGFRSVKFVKQ